MPEGSGRLPVALALAPRLAHEVTLYVERELGWQRVPLEGPPSPALVLAADPMPRGVLGAVPVVLVTESTPADRVSIEGVLDVVLWPRERERLRDCAGRRPPVAAAPVPRLLRVGGAARGVGASTVALALGGLLSWGGRDTVVVGGPDLLRLAGVDAWRGPGADELACVEAARAADEFPRVARRCRGVPRLWLLSGSPGAEPGPGWPVTCAVVEAPSDRADVLVSASPAAQLLWSTGRPAAAAPWSARVARAGRAGRVPVGLPGVYWDALRRGSEVAR